MKLTLYPWQQDCLTAWSAKNGNGIVQVVTGAGKTLLALSAARHLQQETEGAVKVKIIVPKTFMVTQWAESLETFRETFRVMRSEVGFYYGRHKDPPNRRYMVYVIDSARYTLARHILEDLRQGHTVFLIADECHHYASSENRKIFEFLPFLPKEGPKRYYSLGLSATPQANGFDNVLVPALGPVIYSYGFSEAMAGKVINSCILYNVGLFMDAEEAGKYESYSLAIAKLMGRVFRRYPHLKGKSDQQFFAELQHLAHAEKDANDAGKLLSLFYKRSSLVHEAPQRIDCTIALIAGLDAQARIVVFGERIEQCNLLYEQLSARYPGRVVRYHSEMDDTVRKQAIQYYRDGEARILVSCRALDEGFDVPDADVGIVMSGNSQERQRIQRLGRILRRTHGKGVSSLFYLHLEGTTEDATLLAKPIENVREFFLSYGMRDDMFSHPVYDELASHVLKDFSNRQEEESLLFTAKLFLRQGQLRTDWLMDEQVLAGKAGEATTMTEHNYWLCMVAMARARRHM